MTGDPPLDYLRSIHDGALSTPPRPTVRPVAPPPSVPATPRGVRWPWVGLAAMLTGLAVVWGLGFPHP